MAKVRIVMVDGTPALNALGNIYRRPFGPTSEPVKKGVAVRRAFPWEDHLPKGNYEFRYRLQDGEGEYELKQYEGDDEVASHTSGKRDGLMHIGNIFRFKIKG